jgi:DNA-binding transcriptional regulator YiaG
MPNIAAVLKDEITRLARKELRAETDGLRRALAGCRADVSALKKRVTELEKQLARASRPAKRSKQALVGDVGAGDESQGLRFRAAGMAANRKRLGLSASDFGRLVGATGASVYAWEAGKSKPRTQHLAAIAGLRGAGKREVAERLAALA